MKPLKNIYICYQFWPWKTAQIRKSQSSYLNLWIWTCSLQGWGSGKDPRACVIQHRHFTDEETKAALWNHHARGHRTVSNRGETKTQEAWIGALRLCPSWFVFSPSVLILQNKSVLWMSRARSTADTLHPDNPGILREAQLPKFPPETVPASCVFRLFKWAPEFSVTDFNIHWRRLLNLELPSEAVCCTKVYFLGRCCQKQ